MKGHMNTKNGEISIENQVIAKYAGICALGCFGIVGMAMVNMKDGIVKLLTRDNIRRCFCLCEEQQNFHRFSHYCFLWCIHFCGSGQPDVFCEIPGRRVHQSGSGTDQCIR